MELCQLTLGLDGHYNCLKELGENLGLNFTVR